MSLNLIYNFKSSQNLDGAFCPANYRVVYFFSESGFLDTKTLQELAKSVPAANFEKLNFLNLEDLKSFALRVCEELKEQEVRLISVQDCNIGIDGAKDLREFREIFQNYGEVVLNTSAPRKRNFLGKLFT
jgi:hypothetical protein